MIHVPYAEIERLLKEAVQEGEVLHCTFCCPASGEVVTASGPLVQGQTLEDVSAVDSTSLGETLWSAFGGLFRGALAAGPGAGTGGAEAPGFSEGERKAAVALAWDSVSGRFVRDGVTGRLIACDAANSLLSEFSRQLGMAPIREQKDRELAARMMVEVARADGQVTPTEWEFLVAFVPAELSSVDAMMERPALTADELDQASKGAARDTMLLLAWALAYVDTDLDTDETGQLLAYARGLKIPEERALELKRFAIEHLLEEGLRRAYRGGKLDAAKQAEAHALAARLGLDADAVASVEERLKRRLGLD